MEKTDMAMDLNGMSFAEKLKLLSETEKAYIRGYIEKAVIDFQKDVTARRRKQEKAGKEGLHG